MEQDYGRLTKLRNELSALRAASKSEFLIKSIDQVLAEITQRLDALGQIQTASFGEVVPMQRGISPAP